MTIAGQPARKVIESIMAALGNKLGGKLGSVCIRLAQKYVEGLHSRTRKELAKQDQQTGKTLAFSGNHE